MLREVVRLEEALAAASKGLGDRISAGSSAPAVDVDHDPDPVDDRTADGGIERAALPASAEDRGVAPHASRDVARLEDVLTLAPRHELDRIAAEATVPEVAAANASADPAPVDDAPAIADLGVAVPSHVASHVLREAFWFEQASAFKPAAEGEAAATSAPPACAPQVAPVESAAPLEPAPSVAPPAAAPSIAPPEARPPAAPPPIAASVPAPQTVQTPQSLWIGALCILALIALIALLTGRDLRRVSGKRG